MQVHVELSVCLMRWWEISISLKMSLISAWHYELKLMFLCSNYVQNSLNMKMKALLSSQGGQNICISNLSGISRGLSTCTGLCNEFCMGSGEGYSVGSQSLPRGSIYHQSPVSPPELFSCISNSYKRCLGLEWPPYVANFTPSEKRSTKTKL